MTIDKNPLGKPEDTAHPPLPRYRPVLAWSILVLLVLFMVVNWADRTVFALAAQPMMEDLDLTASQFGLLSSSFFFLYSVAAVAVGLLATRLQLKWLLVVLALVWAVTQVPVFLGAGVGLLLASRIMLGAAEGPALPLANAAAYSWFPVEKRGLPSSFITAGASIAKIAVAPLITLIIVGLGWRYAFLALAILSLTWAVVWAFAGKEGPYTRDVKPGPSTSGDRAAERRTFRQVVLSRTFLGLLAATFPMYAMITLVLSWMPSYLETGLGFSRVNSGFLYSLPSVSSLVFMILAGGITDRMLAKGRSNRLARGIVPAVSLTIGGILIALLPVFGSQARYVSLGLLVVGYGLGNLAMPVVYAAIGSLVETTQRSSVISLFVALVNAAGIIAPWATGVLVDSSENKIDGYNTAFLVIGLMIAAGGLAAAVLADPGRDRIPGPDERPTATA
ncbi:MFS transporter [Actinomadura sp. LOL_016]|uniref:MFS transporter n=1 Tax=unclassified Actinomadura TaxID=2626254 RepID=UPI003A800105